jgi:hypothetical protein
MKRPTIYDENVIKQTIEDFYPRVVVYLKSSGFTDEDFDEEYVAKIKQELYSAVEYTDDAYSICRNLEYDYWEIDDELLDLMGNIIHKKYDALENIVKSWVKENNIRLKYFEGDEVTYQNTRTETEHGKIISRNHEEATYTIFSAHLGHVEYGTGTHGRIINQENIIDLIL